jgi:hypothetical protein
MKSNRLVLFSKVLQIQFNINYAMFCFIARRQVFEINTTFNFVYFIIIYKIM